MRKRIYTIIEPEAEGHRRAAGRIYDCFMVITIIASLIPLTTKSTGAVFTVIDNATVIIFIIDYILRLITADYKLNIGKKSFIKYPITFLAIIDLISILPSLIRIKSGVRLLKLIRLEKVLKAARVLRVFKSFRYSRNIQIIIDVFKEQKNALIIVGAMVVLYIIIISLVIFNVEPETFDSIFDAVYWAVISLTTVGYGDIFCVSVTGKIITMISSVLGIAIIALPSGIITAGYMSIIEKEKDKMVPHLEKKPIEKQMNNKANSTDEKNCDGANASDYEKDPGIVNGSDDDTVKNSVK